MVGSGTHAALSTSSSQSRKSQPPKNAPISSQDRTVSAQKAKAGAKSIQGTKSAAIRATPTGKPKKQSVPQARGGQSGINRSDSDARTSSNSGNMSHGEQLQRASTLSSGQSYVSAMSHFSIQPTQERRTLRLVSLKPNQHPHLSSTFYHWGLLLTYPGSDQIGDLYHSRRANRENPNAPELTQQVHSLEPCRGCLPSVSGAGSGYEIYWEYNPYESRRQSVHMNVEVVQNHIAAGDLDRICRMVNATYPYGAMYNNCQNFTIRVLRQMVFEGLLHMQHFETIRTHFYNPMTAQWRLVRDHASDLRSGHH